jgi:hypothetical protein
MNARILLFIFGIGALLLGVSMFFYPLLGTVSTWPSWSVPAIVTAAGALAIFGAAVS